MRDWTFIDAARQILKDKIKDGDYCYLGSFITEVWRHMLLCEDQIIELKEELKKLKGEK